MACYPNRLRTYAAEGLLAPSAVDPASGYRYYSQGQVSDARVIDALRQAGMPLADIRAFLSQPSREQLDACGPCDSKTRRNIAVEPLPLSAAFSRRAKSMSSRRPPMTNARRT